MPRIYVAATTTAVTAVAAPPTTAAHFTLWNGEPLGGKIYTITSVGFTTTTTAGATMIAHLLVHNACGSAGNLKGTAARGPTPLDGLPSTSRAVALSAVTIINDNIWHAVGASVNSAALTATIGLGAWTNVRGLYYLQPGGVFSMATLGSTAAGAPLLAVTWEEC